MLLASWTNTATCWTSCKFDDNGNATIFGIKVIICPSMPSIGAIQRPRRAWRLQLLRHAHRDPDETSGVKTFTEAPGLAENGKVALRTFVRADSNVLYTDTGESVALRPNPQPLLTLNRDRVKPRMSRQGVGLLGFAVSERDIFGKP